MSEDAENSYYNGLQIEAKSQIRKDLTLQLAYTWSRAIDPATGNGGVGDLARCLESIQPRYDFGPSGLDRNQVVRRQFHLRHAVLQEHRTICS